jgi:hypothetical protein
VLQSTNTERGEAREIERWEGIRREDGEGKRRRQRDGREDGVALYPAGKAFSENRVRTD